MPICIINGCDNEAGKRMKTCDLCRASMHRWEKRRPAEILQRSLQLNLYRNRMAQFSVVKDDDVSMRDRETLQDEGVMMFRDVRRKAKATVTYLKTKARKRA